MWHLYETNFSGVGFGFLIKQIADANVELPLELWPEKFESFVK
jgi:hypothetical protein